MDAEKFCSGLVGNDSGGNNCKYGHRVTAACYGNGYPNGKPVPVCVNEDKKLNEDTMTISVANWKGMDGAIAFQLIDRHAEDWNETAIMMQAWLDANKEPNNE